MPFRAAVIGCGAIGSRFADDPRAPGVYSHAGAYAACEGTSLIAVCDTDADRAAACGDRWGVKAYSDPATLFASGAAEIISICTPDPTHAALVRDAIRAPGVKGVLAEKPLALDAREAKALVADARDRGVVLAVNYVRRHSLGHIEMRARLRSGAIGAIQSVGGCYTKGVKHNGGHWFDLARFFVGEVETVTGMRSAAQPHDDDPTLDAVLTFGGGVTAHLRGCDAAAFSIFEMDIIGTSGRMRIVDSGHRALVQDVIDSPHYSGYRTLGTEEAIELDMRDLVLRAVEDLSAAVAERRAPRCSGEDGLAALAIAAAAVLSVETGRPLMMDSVR